MEPRGAVDGGVVGVDIGSTTVKVVARSAPDAPWVTRVARHHGRPAETLAALAGDLAPERVRVGVTGSGAEVLTRRCEVVTAHEVFAAMRAARALHPEAATLLDLGGQDAKLVMLDPRGARPTLVMNDRCAAGTGVTLDRCFARLGITAADAAALPYAPELVLPLSARCGVFAETDLVNHARRGASVAALVASLFDAIARANLRVLARGATPRGPVRLLGGPHAALPGLVDAWRHHLRALWTARDTPHADVALAAHPVFLPALGAALAAEARDDATRYTRDALIDALRRDVATPARRRAEPFAARASVTVERPPWPGDAHQATAPRAPFVLGVDAGSTVTKAVLLDGNLSVRMRLRRASGDVTADARAVLDEARRALRASGVEAPDAVAVTGYGAPQVAALLGADLSVVETVAHARAARHVAPDAEAVCDVGGQDIKVLALQPDGAVGRFAMSSRCAAGIGMALESTARELGVARDDYARRAFEATEAPWFHDGCAVFLDADRVSFQRQGFTPEALLAGLARALPRVVWSQVAGGAPVASFGRVVVLQGGVQHNEAALRAQAEHIVAEAPGARVLVHPLPDLAGALGAALFAHDLTHRASPPRRALPLQAPRAVEAPACTLCENRCPRATLLDGERATDLVLGNACEAGATLDARAGARARRALDDAVPDLYAWEAAALFRDDPAVVPVVASRRRLRVAIPRALALYRAAPLLRAYLRALGVAARDVVFSPPTSDALWTRGGHLGATDPCFPVKALLAHAQHLLDTARCDVLFIPRVTQATTCVRHTVDSASCPVVAASPALVRAALGDALAARGTTLLDPELDLTHPARLAAQLHDAFGALLAVTRAESDGALDEARRVATRFDAALQARGRALLEAAAPGRGVVLVLARPYHVDPGICHHVGAELQSLGYPSLSIRALPRDGTTLATLFAEDVARASLADAFDIRDLLPESDNSGGAERLWAARFAARHERVGVIDLSSFKCAQDAPTAAPIARLLRERETPYCALHDLDETRPRASLRVALRTFAHAMQRRGYAPWT